MDVHDYHLPNFNCCHFADEFSRPLTLWKVGQAHDARVCPGDWGWVAFQAIAA